ncbi:hypothetical protein EON83_01330 [bacterium]|nr:MAG: hypothetical protein EON83_01330 [bacterium]
MNSIHSWQLPCDVMLEPNVASYVLSLEGLPREWEVFTMGFPHNLFYTIYLRNIERDDYFCVFDKFCNAERPFNGAFFDKSLLEEVLIQVSTGTMKFRAGRVFFLNEAGQLRGRGEIAHSLVSICHDGEGSWILPDGWARQRAAFQLFSDEGVGAFIERSAFDIWGQLQGALDDPSAPASFAWQWSLLDDEEKTDRFWNWPRDSREAQSAEFQDWLLCALLCEDSLWEQGNEWTIFVSEPDNSWVFGFDKHDHCEAPPQLGAAVERLWNHFAPFNGEYWGQRCVMRWMPSLMRQFQAYALQPSQHERMEAKLRWRNWLAEHGE